MARSTAFGGLQQRVKSAIKPESATAPHSAAEPGLAAQPSSVSPVGHVTPVRKALADQRSGQPERRKAALSQALAFRGWRSVRAYRRQVPGPASGKEGG